MKPPTKTYLGENRSETRPQKSRKHAKGTEKDVCGRKLVSNGLGSTHQNPSRRFIYDIKILSDRRREQNHSRSTRYVKKLNQKSRLKEESRVLMNSLLRGRIPITGTIFSALKTPISPQASLHSSRDAVTDLYPKEQH
jgi:hypothetical protein